MQKIVSLLTALFLVLAMLSCSKRSYPGRAVSLPESRENTVSTIKRNDSVVVTKAVLKRKAALSTPGVIVVNDKYANKSVDGRLYYDLQGHRYWRNNKDRKYHLFNKSMLTDDAYKKQGY